MPQKRALPCNGVKYLATRKMTFHGIKGKGGDAGPQSKEALGGSFRTEGRGWTPGSIHSPAPAAISANLLQCSEIKS